MILLSSPSVLDRGQDEMKHRIVHTLQKYLLNPPIKLALAMGLPAGVCVGRNHWSQDAESLVARQWATDVVGKQFWLVAEHGMKAGYVLNMDAYTRVRLKLRDGLRSRWHTGTAHLLPDDDPRERQRWLASHLPSSAGNARAVRLFGTQLLTVRIDLDG